MFNTFFYWSCSSKRSRTEWDKSRSKCYDKELWNTDERENPADWVFMKYWLVKVTFALRSWSMSRISADNNGVISRRCLVERRRENLWTFEVLPPGIRGSQNKCWRGDVGFYLNECKAIWGWRPKNLYPVSMLCPSDLSFIYQHFNLLIASKVQQNIVLRPLLGSAHSIRKEEREGGNYFPWETIEKIWG